MRITGNGKLVEIDEAEVAAFEADESWSGSPSPTLPGASTPSTPGASGASLVSNGL